MNRVFHPLTPFVFEDSETLILGSFPSLKSFEEQFYYAHPKNQFWKILSQIYGVPSDTKEQRMELLQKAKIALWDVIASCERTNSADSNLKKAIPNDTEELLRSHPAIKRIFFTGRTAQTLYKKHFGHVELPTSLLPSPSPAYASVRYEVKLLAWKSVLAG